jgi:hypothetical protein
MGIAATLAENAQTLINLATGQVSTVELAGSNVTLAQDQYNTSIIELIGALGANVVVTFPNTGKWAVYNNTTGAFSVTLADGVGATAVVTQGQVTEIVVTPDSGILVSSVGGGGGSGVSSFNTRTGAVTLESSDVTAVGGALTASPVFTGAPTAPTATAGTNTQQLATTAFVEAAVSSATSNAVSSFNTRTGAVTLEGSDIASAGGALLASPAFTGVPTAPTPTAGTNNTDLATTAFVGTALTSYAPLASPALTGAPTAPTPLNTSNSTALATTAFVQSMLSAVTGGLNYQGTWNANTNTPALASGVGTKGYLYQVDVAGSTTLDGNSTWDVGDFANFNGTVYQRIPAQTTGVTSFNTRTGSVTLSSADVDTALGFTPANATSIVDLAPLASPGFTGVPTAPTAAAGTNTTQVATTAFVVGTYAPLASPTFTGVPLAPTATAGTNTTQVATTAFVAAAVSAVGGSYAPLASPAFTGVPTGPTAAPGVNTQQLATTAFVNASFAPLASPVFTGAPAGPTATAGTNTTQLATTAFVTAAVGSVGSLYAPLANPAFTGVPTAPTATAGTATTQLATTAFVNALLTNPTFTGRVQSDASSYTVDALGNVSGNVTLNLGTASEWTMTITGTTTFTFTNTLAANLSEVVYLRLVNAGSATINWPALTKFAGKTAPSYTVSGTDLFGVKYDTTSSSYMVFVVGLNIG